jgi:hypothetical protein
MASQFTPEEIQEIFEQYENSIKANGRASEELTKKYKDANKQRKFVWDGSTVMDFLITEYNDPNLIYKMFSVKINDLVGKTVTIKNVSYDNFSVYTRRLFKNYVIEYK